jgi:methyl-accepting chemotaxis protein
MTLRAKLILAFSMVASVPLVGGAIGIYSHRLAVRRAEEASAVAHQAVALLDATRVIQLSSESAERDPSWAAQEAAAIRGKLAELEMIAPTFSLSASDLSAVAPKPDGSFGPGQSAAARALVATAQERIDAAQHASDEAFGRETWLLDALMGVGTLAGIALGIGFGVVTSFAVTRHIRGIAGQIWQEADQVTDSVTHVAASSRDLAAASSQQAASLEETSAALIEVNTIVKTNASHAHDARAISHQNRSESDRSAQEVAELQSAMTEMSAAYANIAKIVHSIDEIAFQTNILALNAAVEAARAGEAGAGFAVVADEVRNLAQRSAAAARETSHKIADALSKSTRGAEVAARVEESLRKVISDARRVDELIGRIADASVEQARGLDQAVSSMKRIDQLTQSNTASAEQTAAVAERLDAETHAMRAHLSGLLEGAAKATPTAAVASSPMPSHPRLAEASLSGRATSVCRAN